MTWASQSKYVGPEKTPAVQELHDAATAYTQNLTQLLSEATDAAVTTEGEHPARDAEAYLLADCFGVGSSKTCLVRLRREFENLSPALGTVASRWSRGVYKGSSRPAEPSITDSRGRVVRSVGMAQTFLSAPQVDELVTQYRDGVTAKELGERFGHYHMVTAHLVRRSVPLRRRGLSPEHAAEAARLYESGLTLMEVGRKFGVSQGVVRRVVADAGVTVRQRGRRAGELDH